MPAADYTDAVERGIVLLWCDDTIVPPIGQLVAVCAPDINGRCEWKTIGPEFEVEDWSYDGRILSYEDAARRELDTRIRAFVLSPSEFWLLRLIEHAKHLHFCEIPHPLLMSVLMNHCKVAAQSERALDEQCGLIREKILADYQADQ